MVKKLTPCLILLFLLNVEIGYAQVTPPRGKAKAGSRVQQENQKKNRGDVGRNKPSSLSHPAVNRSEVKLGIGLGLPILILPSAGPYFYAKFPKYHLGVETYYAQTKFTDPEFQFSGPSFGFGVRYYPDNGGFYVMAGFRQRRINIVDPENFETTLNGEIQKDVIRWDADFRQTHLTTMIGWNIPITGTFCFDIAIGLDVLLSSGLSLSFNELNPDLVTSDEIAAKETDERKSLNKYFKMPVMGQILVGASYVFSL